MSLHVVDVVKCVVAEADLVIIRFLVLLSIKRKSVNTGGLSG